SIQIHHKRSRAYVLEPVGQLGHVLPPILEGLDNLMPKYLPIGAWRTRKRFNHQHVRSLLHARDRLLHPGLAAAAKHHVTVKMHDVLGICYVQAIKQGIKISSIPSFGRNCFSIEEISRDRALGGFRIVDIDNLQLGIAVARITDEPTQFLEAFVEVAAAVATGSAPMRIDSNHDAIDAAAPSSDLMRQ